MKPYKNNSADDPIASLEQRDRFLLQAEMPRNEKSVASLKTKESVNKEWYSIEPLAPGPFPSPEKTETEKISSNIQNTLKGRGP
jgi:hypothetical protein